MGRNNHIREAWRWVPTPPDSLRTPRTAHLTGTPRTSGLPDNPRELSPGQEMPSGSGRPRLPRRLQALLAPQQPRRAFPAGPWPWPWRATLLSPTRFPRYFGHPRHHDHTADQFTLPHLETQSSGKNRLFSVWLGSFATACNFGEGSDFLSDRKQEPKQTLAAANLWLPS